MLSLHLLGGAAIEADQRRVTGRCTQRHQIALLALLATDPHQTLSRDKLIGLLWPESDTKHARNLLNVSVYTIRKALGEDSLQSVGDGIRLADGRWHVDVVDFEAAVTTRNLERVASVYAGPFLDGFFLSDASEFNRWQEVERDRLARQYAGALEALATAAEAAGDPPNAVGWWRRLAAHDPYDSKAALGLMRALARSGNRARAIQHAQAHAAFLRDELGIEPSREVTAFAAAVTDVTDVKVAAQAERGPPSAGPAQAAAQAQAAPGGALSITEVCLENEPDRRPHRAADLVHVLDTVTSGTPAPPSTTAAIAVEASPHVTWRRTAVGGTIAVGAFVLLVAGYVAPRALGISPAGSLLASGAIANNERLLVADFASPASDTTLGPVLTEAFRTALAESRSVTVLQSSAVSDVLRRMQRPVASRLDFSLAREIATREGIKAVVDGEFIGVAGSYVISARLVAAQSGEVLASFRETADNSKGLLPAVDRLSKDFRAKIGESLKSVRAAPRLEQVTTPSLDALQKYVHGSRALSVGQVAKGVALLEEAIALDTGFAMAYRRLAAELTNQGGQHARVAALLQKAYDHRDRLSDAERYLTVGAYHHHGPRHDAAKAIAAYEALLDIQPDNYVALNNAAQLYRHVRNPAKAEEYARRVMSAVLPASPSFTSLIVSQVMLGKVAEAEQTVEHFVRAMPATPNARVMRARFAFMRGEYDRADRILREVRAANAADPSVRDATARRLAVIAMTAGRLAEARRWTREAREAQRERGVAHAPLLLAELDEALRLAWFLGETDRAARLADSALASHPLDSIPPADCPYAELADIYALAGRTDRARAMLAAFDKRPAVWFLNDEAVRHQMLGDIAMAERRYPDAVREYRESDRGACVVCALPNVARAYDLAGNADTAIAVFTRYIETPSLPRELVDGRYLAGAHKRLGELYEARGDRARAASYYAKFVDLWKDADPELQLKVAEVRRRLARLTDSEGRR